MNKTSVLRLAASSVLTLSALFSAPSMAQQAQTYVTLEQAQPSDTLNKTEVLEFFSYSCPHCATAEPLVAEWATKLPENTVLQRVPIAFNAGMVDLQRMYYTLEAMDRLDLHEALFKALHQERKPLFDAKALTQWAADQGIDQDEFTKTFNSFGVNTKISKANDLARAYRIEATPSLAVGGKYVTNPSMARGIPQMLELANGLLAQ
ncbi:thiol:disulfide interchange protein DsbA/DsbL [Alcaligenaceae bacterium 429]|uniref:thiol:disulfide interchange protein DsbA/DsbL n=1 Tax=Paenalcaligenes sp. Me52 TaxID=3392038 RepID=UPI0010924F5B|nr:thiol:disulfide interchange protein DsbA/DsbL [Alcaligenaceae bacterium 429]